LLHRRLGPVVERLLNVEPDIALHGPRSVGKSTLLRQVAMEPHLSASTSTGHVPEILSAIKARLNREGSLPGTTLPTGSTCQDALPRTSEALTGCLHHLTILPLSQGEIGGVTENLLPLLLAGPDASVAALSSSSTTRQDYAKRICAGGFLLTLQRSAIDPDRWFADYISQSAERDVRELTRIRDRQLFGRS